MQLKYLVYKKCVHLSKFIVPSTVAVLAVCRNVKMAKKTVMRARKKDLGD